MKITVLEHLSYEDRLRVVGVVQPGEEKAQGRAWNSLSIVKGDFIRKMGDFFFFLSEPVITGEGTRLSN